MRWRVGRSGRVRVGFGMRVLRRNGDGGGGRIMSSMPIQAVLRPFPHALAIVVLEKRVLAFVIRDLPTRRRLPAPEIMMIV